MEKGPCPSKNGKCDLSRNGVAGPQGRRGGAPPPQTPLRGAWSEGGDSTSGVAQTPWLFVSVLNNSEN